MAHKKITHLLLIFVFMISYVVSLPATAAPLHDAAKEGNLQQVVKLIEEGEDINAKDNYGGTALHLAVIYSHKDVVELLIAKGADVCANVNGVTPLHYATETINLKEGNDNYEIVKLLITHGADVDIKENSFGQDRNSPLHWAVLTAHRDIVELLIEKNVDINSMGQFGHTPLHIASNKNNLDIAKFLIAKGAEVNAKDEMGHTPLHSAAFCGHKDIVELLIKNGADVNIKGYGLFDYTPLSCAISQGHTDIVEYLLANGANILSVNREGRTPLHKAAVNGHIEIVEFLLNKGVDVNTRDSSGVTPLGLAVGKHRDRKELPDIRNSEEYCKRGDYFYRKNKFDRAIEDYVSAVLMKEENDYAYYSCLLYTSPSPRD